MAVFVGLEVQEFPEHKPQAPEAEFRTFKVLRVANTMRQWEMINVTSPDIYLMMDS